MSRFDLPVPVSENEVTKEWLQTVLVESFPHASYSSLKGERIGENYGFASRIFRFKWQDNESPQSVIIKFWETDGKAGIGEINFYQTFNDVGIRVPICFFSAVEESTKRAVLVLEDLNDAIQGDVLEPVNLNRAKRITQSLATLHSTWLEHPMLAELSWIPDMSTISRDADWFHSRRALFLERFPDRLHGLAHLLLDKIEFVPKIINARWADEPLTLLHGDLHLDNILFENLIEPVFLDWSNAVKGVPAINLVNLLFAMTPLENFDLLFEYYLDEFNKVSENTLTPAVLENQMGGAFLHFFATGTCGTALWQPSLPRAIETLDKGIGRLSEIVLFWKRRDPALFSFL